MNLGQINSCSLYHPTTQATTITSRAVGRHEARCYEPRHVCATMVRLSTLASHLLCRSDHAAVALLSSRSRGESHHQCLPAYGCSCRGAILASLRPKMILRCVQPRCNLIRKLKSRLDLLLRLPSAIASSLECELTSIACVQSASDTCIVVEFNCIVHEKTDDDRLTYVAC